MHAARNHAGAATTPPGSTPELPPRRQDLRRSCHHAARIYAGAATTRPGSTPKLPPRREDLRWSCHHAARIYDGAATRIYAGAATTPPGSSPDEKLQIPTDSEILAAVAAPPGAAPHRQELHHGARSYSTPPESQRLYALHADVGPLHGGIGHALRNRIFRRPRPLNAHGDIPSWRRNRWSTCKFTNCCGPGGEPHISRGR